MYAHHHQQRQQHFPLNGIGRLMNWDKSSIHCCYCYSACCHFQFDMFQIDSCYTCTCTFTSNLISVENNLVQDHKVAAAAAHYDEADEDEVFDDGNFKDLVVLVWLMPKTTTPAVSHSKTRSFKNEEIICKIRYGRPILPRGKSYFDFESNIIRNLIKPHQSVSGAV
ncbi:hypothetical protein FF38_06777 [Lucilia cuprina]|uniref:Uncharacterized protein n=1 Tax=Lucilia cuprina TaxID=7375 RepID=A0A0L0CRH6_LUCCU|nr:hypothetical protein FF38_06777 [Lucilia cuprina]